jgi:hypothetical protein
MLSNFYIIILESKVAFLPEVEKSANQDFAETPKMKLTST